MFHLLYYIIYLHGKVMRLSTKWLGCKNDRGSVKTKVAFRVRIGTRSHGIDTASCWLDPKNLSGKHTQSSKIAMKTNCQKSYQLSIQLVYIQAAAPTRRGTLSASLTCIAVYLKKFDHGITVSRILHPRSASSRRIQL